MRVRISFLVFGAFLLLSMFSLGRLRAASAPAGQPAADASRTPVLIELFTSEGCSDCPPADVLLEKLDRSQPVDGADLIVLSEHVDYWNDIGWADPYSSHEYSERQGSYAGRFGLPSVYTPQMVVDGRFQLVGSDERGAISAIENAKKAETVHISLSSIRLTGKNAIALHVQSDPLPPSVAQTSADIWIAVADASDESHVTRGENGGKTLKHVAVLRGLTRVGSIARSAGFSRDISVDLNHANSQNLRLVAFVQQAPAGRVWGVASARYPN